MDPEAGTGLYEWRSRFRAPPSVGNHFLEPSRNKNKTPTHQAALAKRATNSPSPSDPFSYCNSLQLIYLKAVMIYTCCIAELVLARIWVKLPIDIF